MTRSDLRHSVRVDCVAPAEAEGPRGPRRGICRNLSRGGMFFSGAPLPVGQAVDFAIDLPGGRVLATAEVRYRHVSGDEQGMGVRFVRIAGDGLRQIDAYLGRNV